MNEAAPFFPKNMNISYDMVKDLHVIYEELGVGKSGRDGIITTAITRKTASNAADSYVTLRIVVRELSGKAIIVEAIKITHLSFQPDAPICIALWDIEELPLFDIEYEKTPLTSIRARNVLIIYKAIKSIHKLMLNYHLNEIDKSITVYIHKGLEDIFKRLMFKMGKIFSLEETWDMGSKYILRSPNIYELVEAIGEPTLD